MNIAVLLSVILRWLLLWGTLGGFNLSVTDCVGAPVLFSFTHDVNMAAAAQGVAAVLSAQHSDSSILLPRFSCTSSVPTGSESFSEQVVNPETLQSLRRESSDGACGIATGRHESGQVGMRERKRERARARLQVRCYMRLYEEVETSSRYRAVCKVIVDGYI